MTGASQSLPSGFALWIEKLCGTDGSALVNWTVQGWLAATRQRVRVETGRDADRAETWTRLARQAAEPAAKPLARWPALLLGHPGVEVGGRHRLDGEVHVGVADAAELGALAGVRAGLLDE